MNISFVVTTFNIERYVRQCLESLRHCLRAGDQVILVDDGSTDETEQVIRDFVEEGGFGEGVRWTPIWLGVNTIGGVGIGANIGMDHAECETLFFVDGDDYLIPEGFRKARRAYEAHPTDIRIVDYLEYDERADRTRLPADAARWDGLSELESFEDKRLAAIGLIAVPWRKFYRRAFLQRHRIRFPEGDFFFEDNPFHWQVCTKAESIAFSREIVCHHRINRPGQTMASNGAELTAFFTHYRTIASALPGDRPDLRLQAARWLVNQMSWHIPRLQPAAYRAYAVRAQETLQRVADTEWEALSADMAEKAVWHYADRLRRGGAWEVVEAWQANEDRKVQRGIARDLRDLRQMLRSLEGQVKTSREILQAQQAIDEFAAFQALTSRG